ncbi:MAG: hypothetical protein H7263_05605 [Candidatus Sericytochromatia bacterium]|nr:hypothetical protein [Candidatus Sericytochromatia bacterium]
MLPVGSNPPVVGTPPVGTNPTTLPTLPPAPGSITPSSQSLDSFTQISSIVGSGLGGGIGTLKSMGNLKLIGQGMKGVEVPTGMDDQTTNVGGGIGSKMKGIGMGARGLGSSAVTGAKYGAIAGGVVSALSNGYKVLTGKESSGEAVGSLAADTITATLSGAGGAVLGGMTTLGLSSLVGMGGLPLTILAAGVGLAGAVGIQVLTQKTGLYDSIKNAVKGLVGAK